ncbi:SPOSA6832_04660, partial [Sporobolomyces salmonicolor]
MATSAPPSTSTKPDLVAVIGTTGVGKSQLGVELAKSLVKRAAAPTAGEVLNHDSMQCYRGLDVITNKATPEEMDGVPHHLMGFLEPGDEWGVTDFQRDAISKLWIRPRLNFHAQIDELRARGTLSIAVGGTSYYLQNLVFPNQLVADVASSSRPSSPEPPSASPKTLDDVADFPPRLLEAIKALPAELLSLFFVLPALPDISTPDDFPPRFPLDLLPPRLRSPETLVPALYTLLKTLDPASADRWHWRDVRKVRRALDIVWEGRRWEDVVSEQQQKSNEGPRQAFRTLIFWLFAENQALHPRLDGRVDKMIERGLLLEIDELWQIAHALDAQPTNYSKGIYQSIGYKEFEPYLSARHRDPSRTLENHDELRRVFDMGVENMKTSTRQYAKRQVKWIKSKLLPAVRKLEDQSDVTVVLLDASAAALHLAAPESSR